MNGTRMRTRSQVPPSERNVAIPKQKEESIENLPFIEYHGKIYYYITFPDIAAAGQCLLDEAERKADSEIYVLGFDLEWPFSFKTGPGKTALMQISPSLDICYLLHLSALKNLPKSITELLIHPKVRLTGINIKNDVRKLSRDFKGINADRVIENCIDLGPIANSISDCKQRWSMEKLIMRFFKLRINKSKSVRMSRWNEIPLKTEQQVYASIDAYASLKLYIQINQLASEINEKENEILSQNSMF